MLHQIGTNLPIHDCVKLRMARSQPLADAQEQNEAILHGFFMIGTPTPRRSLGPEMLQKVKTKPIFTSYSQSTPGSAPRFSAPRPAKSQNEANLHKLFTIGAWFGAEVFGAETCKKSKRSQSSRLLHDRRRGFRRRDLQEVKTKPILPEWQSRSGTWGETERTKPIFMVSS